MAIRTLSEESHRVERIRSGKNPGKLPVSIGPGQYLKTEAACFHGGAFFNAIGVEFDTLSRSREIINADVLDAWFPPSPKVLGTLQEHLPWLLRTSPPTRCEGLIRTVARTRGVDPKCVLPGAGSSDLIFLALRQWLTPSSRVLILDPMYGEYAHVLKHVIGCRVDRLLLRRDDGYQLDLSALTTAFKTSYDLVILVNPNSPTGRFVPREDIEKALKCAPVSTRIWVDETYVEYAGSDQSIERFASTSPNIVVCKSMSKVYALSGLRVAYLCASAQIVQELKPITPPWAVSLPAQVAAVMALQDPDYYAKRYQETHVLREDLSGKLTKVTGMDIVPGIANFILCHLPEDGPDAETVIHTCQGYGLFLRDAAPMGSLMGQYAVRMAVKDADTNNIMVTILKQACLKKSESK